MSAIPPNRADSKIFNVDTILNKDLINRDDIDELNRVYREIEIREQSEEIDFYESSTYVLELVINKVNLYIKNKENIPAESLVSLFYLSCFNDFQQIDQVFKKIASLATSNQGKKERVVKRISIIMPTCRSLDHFEEDAIKLLKTISPSMSKQEILYSVQEKRDHIRKQLKIEAQLRKKEEELHYFKYATSKGAVTRSHDASFLKPSTNFSGWHFLGDLQASHSVISAQPTLLGDLAYQIKSNPVLVDNLEQAKKMKSERNNDVLAVLGTTQVGKSSTLNFLSGQTPYIERGFVKSTDFETQEEVNGVTLNKKDGEIIFNYLLEHKLIEHDEEETTSGGEEEWEPCYYVPSFQIGEKVLGAKKNDEITHLKTFIYEQFPDKENSAVFSHITNQLAAAIRKKNRSDDGKPSIGFSNPIFSYGAGVSTTIIAQSRQQEWNVTTIDLPGSGEVRGAGYSLVSAYSARNSLANTCTVKGAAILISYEQLTGGATNAEALIKVLQSADDMLGETIDTDNICILVTKVPLMKKVKKRRQVTEVKKTDQEIHQEAKDKLEAFHELLGHNSSCEFSKLRKILSEVIEKDHFGAVTPLKTMEDDYIESAAESNVNMRNRSQVIELLSKLRPVKVTENYFSRTYSIQNGNIAQTVSLIQDEVLNLSSQLSLHRDQIKTLFTELDEKYTTIVISVNMATKYIEEAKKSMEFEQLSFENAVRSYTEGGDIETLKFSRKMDVKQEVDEIKKLAIVRAKQQITDSSYRSGLKRTKKGETQSSEAKQLNDKMRKIKAEIENKKREIRIKEAEKKRKGNQEESIITKNINRDEYWYQGDVKETLAVNHKDYPLEGSYTIHTNTGGFAVSKTKINNPNQSKVEFKIVSKKNVGMFSNYKLSCVLALNCKASDRLDYEINRLKKEIESLDDDRAILSEKIKMMKSLEENEKLLNSATKEISTHLEKEGEKYHGSLETLKKTIGIEGDKAQVMSISDIKKVMIGSIADSCEKDIKEANRAIEKVKELFCDPKTAESISTIRQEIANYKELINLVEINLFDTKFGSATKLMTLPEMEDTVEEIIKYEDKCKHVLENIDNYKDRIKAIKGELKELKLNVDNLDEKIERHIARYRRSSVSGCIVM